MVTKRKTTKATEKSKSLINELERSGEAINREVIKHLQTAQDKVMDVAHTMSDTTLAVKDKVTGEETRKRLLELADDMEEGGKYVLGQLTEIVSALQKSVTNTVEGLAKAALKRTSAKKKIKKKAKKATKKKAPRKVSKKKAKKKAAKKKAKKKVAKKAVRKTKTRAIKVPGKKKRTNKRATKKR